MFGNNDIQTVAPNLSSTRELCVAAAKGDVKEIKSLLMKNIDVNAADYDGRTPLHIASSEGQEKAVRVLLKVENINVNPIDKYHRFFRYTITRIRRDNKSKKSLREN
jgi:ankyrin repeat protein